MSRKERRKALGYVPNITFQGTELDRALSGVVTPALLEQARKNKLLNEPHFDLPGNSDILGPTPFVVKPLPSLIAVMVKDICACGGRDTHFGYYARMNEEKVADGEPVRSFKFVDKPIDKPTMVRYETRYVPFCHHCIPNGLNVIN